MEKSITYNKSGNTQERNIVYLEILRILACFLVIFNHTNGYHLYLEETLENDGIKTLIHMSVSIITKINVPIFLMISGAVLLGKRESFRKVFSKRIVKIFVIIGLISFVKYTYAYGISNFDILKFVTKVIQGKIATPYWYLYTYLGALCMLPFIRSIAQNMTGKHYMYLLFLHFLMVSVRPIVGLINKDFVWSGDFAVEIATVPSIFYLLMGYGINKYFDVRRMSKSKGILFTGLVVICIGIADFITITNPNQEGVYTQKYVQLFDYVLAIYVFILVKCICDKINFKDRTKRILCVIGSLTFGMYLLDPIMPQKIIDLFYNNLGDFKGSFIYCIFSMILCGMITYVGKSAWSKVKKLYKKIEVTHDNSGN